MFGIRAPPGHSLTVFILLFGQNEFGEVQRVALNEGKKWETGVRNDLANTVSTTAPLSFLDHHLRCGDSLFGE